MLLALVRRGQRWWTRSCTQSASPTAWRSSLWRMQDSNRRFPSTSPVIQPSANLISFPFLPLLTFHLSFFALFLYLLQSRISPPLLRLYFLSLASGPLSSPPILTSPTSRLNLSRSAPPLPFLSFSCHLF